MDSTRHRGSTALVTGAASGIGRATALRIAAEGARVVCVDLHDEPLAKVVAEVEGAGGAAVAVAGDVSDQAVVDAAVAACDGRLDLLVNNAGIMDFFLPVDAVDDETWSRVLAVNTTAVMRFCRAAVPLMKTAGHGAIVNVASAAGTMGGAAGVAYTASKHAVVGITRNVAVLYGADGIRCNAVTPGGVATNIAQGGAVPKVPWVYERLAATSFVRAPRVADADELAAVVSWLGSEDASDVNGAVLPVDGGWSAF
jgi:NAD(P)-dependent dehydrogenase (short-subunit alcohol dehydrogenase family)